MMGPGGQYRANSMPQVYKHYIDGGTGTGPPQRRFKNLEDIVCFKVRPNSRSIVVLNCKLKSPAACPFLNNMKLLVVTK